MLLIILCGGIGHVQVTREDGVDAGFHQLTGDVIVVFDNVIGQQAVLLVKVFH